MANRLAPMLSRRLAAAMNLVDSWDEAVRVRTAVEKAGADTDGPGELTYDELPEPVRKAIERAEGGAAFLILRG